MTGDARAGPAEEDRGIREGPRRPRPRKPQPRAAAERPGWPVEEDRPAATSRRDRCTASRAA